MVPRKYLSAPARLRGRPREARWAIGPTIALVVAAVFLVVPIGAQAAPFPPRLNFAYKLAIDYWDQKPDACGSIDKQIVPPGSLGDPQIGAVSAKVTQPAPEVPPGSVNCILWVDRAYAEPIIFDLLCAVMVHNVGHLLGMSDTSDPADVMYEGIPVPGFCNAKGRQAVRLYFLRMKFHRLQQQRGNVITQKRRYARRALKRQARHFWSSGP